jgi:hypothetical protein
MTLMNFDIDNEGSGSEDEVSSEADDSHANS